MKHGEEYDCSSNPKIQKEYLLLIIRGLINIDFAFDFASSRVIIGHRIKYLKENIHLLKGRRCF